MEDSELEQIRKARLEQLKAEGGSGAAGATNSQTAEQLQAEVAARRNILDQILHPEAADRLGRIRLVKEDRATAVEDRLIALARAGQLRRKVTEDQLKDMLAALAAGSSEEKIVVSRRKGWDGDDDDDLSLDL